MRWSFCVLPGDDRQDYLRDELSLAGHDVTKIDAPGARRAVIMPLGQVDEGCVLDRLGGCDVLFGRVSDAAASIARERGIRVYDLLSMEDFALRNALITAEGALMLAIVHTQGILCGCEALVLGYGRVGRLTTRRLLALGARVRAASKCEWERAQADCDGARGIELRSLAAEVESADLVINTIPAPVLPGEIIDRLPPETPVIDLASAPGCSPGEERVIRAPGLPGKTAPRAAARAMMRCVLACLEKID